MTPPRLVDAGGERPRRHAGKLADIVLLDGDPLQNIANTYTVKRVIANGRVYDVTALPAAAQQSSAK